MQNKKKTIVITILIWAGFIPYCLSATSTRNTKSKHPTAFELLDKYAENQNKLKSFIAKTEHISTLLHDDPTQPAKVEQSTVEFRYEDSGSDLSVYYGFCDLNQEDDGAWVPADRSKSLLWKNKQYYRYYRSPSLEFSTVTVSSDKNHIKQAIAIGYQGAGSILGILYGDLDRIDSILRKSDSISVRSEFEQIGSIDCYVIDAKSEHGKYTIWLDPEHGYGIAKATVHKGPEDHLFGLPISSHKNAESYKGLSFFLENVRFENVEGVWIPMEADYRTVDNEQSSTGTWQDHYKMTQIDIDPNHAELQSFVLDVQNGTIVRILESPGINYTWQEGMKFITDEWDGSIKYVPKDWSILVSVGKPLPKFEGIILVLSAEQINNKAILLCFFDMEQRPSRNCIMQLAKQAQELKEKNIEVVAIQASKINENKLNEWAKENNIPFTVGMVQGDEEKTRFSWGVKSLPWLILTDKERIVRAEGFSINELNEIFAKEKKP